MYIDLEDMGAVIIYKLYIISKKYLLTFYGL